MRIKLTDTQIRCFTEAIKAVESDRIDAVVKAVNAGCEVYGKCPIEDSMYYKCNLLHVAAIHAGPQVAKYLIDNGCDVNFKDDNGESPIYWLLERRSEHTADLLNIFLRAVGVDINQKDKDGNSYLMEAAFHNNLAHMQALVDKNINLNLKNVWGERALHWAAGPNNVEAVDFLLTRGHMAQINAQDNEGNTPLCSAIIHGSYEAAKLLLERGANTNIINSQGKNLAVLASEYADERMAELVKSSKQADDKPILKISENIEYQRKQQRATKNLTAIAVAC